MRSTGVNVIGDFTAEIGLSEAASKTLNAMLEQGVPLSYAEIQYPFDRRRREVDPRWLSLPRGSVYPLNFVYFNVDQMHWLSDEQLEQLTQGKYTIGYWVWELPRIPLHFLNEFSRVDEIWVPSQFVQQSMQTVASTPVVVVPHPIELTTSAHIDRKRFGIPDDRYVFLFTFSGTSSFARKNPWALIDAFERAFGHTRDDGPLLVIKAHHLDLNPKLQADLRHAVGRVGGILLEAQYSRQEVNDLLACADVYVSLHRSEGFGLGLAEAMSLGKPAIATYYSANVDYMNAENSYPVEYRLREITEDDHRHEPHLIGHYQAGQLWAEPDIEQAAQLMRHVFENQEEARYKGARAAQFIHEYCSPPVVGKLIEERLHQIEREPRTPRAIRRFKDQTAEMRSQLREALNAWERLRHIMECIPMAQRPVIGSVMARLGRLPVVGGLLHTFQTVRFLRQLLRSQDALNTMYVAETQSVLRLVASLDEVVNEIQSQATEERLTALHLRLNTLEVRDKRRAEKPPDFNPPDISTDLMDTPAAADVDLNGMRPQTPDRPLRLEASMDVERESVGDR